MLCQVQEQDSLALVALYDSTGGVNWNNNTNWLTGPVSSWYGITVTGNRVTKIDLEDNNLQGNLPSKIGDLTALTHIYFINNQLSGAIPSTLGDLLQLERLYLHENQLTDSIPSELGNLSQLTSLELGDNQLSGTMPKEIFNLTNLTSLSLYENNLFGSLPQEINQLTNLQILSISNNQFDGTIPSEIGELTHLEYIDFFSNQFSGALPEEMINLTNLKRLNLFNNQFTHLPDLSSISTLVGLKIENNKFTFEDIEPHISIATFTYSPQDSVGKKQDTLVTTGSTLVLSLQVGGEYNQYQWFKNEILISEAEDSVYTITPVVMSDSGNYSCEITNTLAPDLTLYSRPIQVSVELSGIEKDSLALVALYNSTVGDNWTDNANWLSGTVSDWFGITVTDERVKKIELPNNNLVGVIPAEIGNLDSLETLELWSNSLSDSLPPEIGLLTNLDWIRIGSNQFTGPIPEEIWNLTNLIYLSLGRNELTGSLSASIGNLNNLSYLDLSNNELAGSIPAEIGNLTNLSWLGLGFNDLTGIIPVEIGNLTEVYYLNLAGNQLTGSIPAEIGNLTLLESLLLYNNQIEGSIPAELGNLVRCKTLELENNQLSGPIPSTIGNMDSLQYLRLWNNSLEGPIPGSLGKLSALTRIELSNNQLTGEVPDSLNLLSKLVDLCLDSNRLTDLPDLSTMTQLNTLWIQQNQFTFEDIEPNITISTFIYSPQDSVGEKQDTLITTGSTLDLSIQVGGEYNQYQWYKDGIQIAEADDSSHIISQIIMSDSGTFSCEITNTRAPDLTLYSRPIQVNVEMSGIEKDSLALVAFYESTDGANWTDNSQWLSGPVADWFGITVTNERVKEIELHNNNVVGIIPSEIGELDSLERLELWYNSLSDSIPPEIGLLTNLERIRIGNNQFTGPIPDEMWNLINLKYLSLNSNELTGSIPASIENLNNLIYLNLNSNELTGSIPPEIGNLTKLIVMELGYNELDGTIPVEICNLTELYSINLAGNQLTGSIPAEIGNLTLLEGLYLYYNQLDGSIPTEIGNLRCCKVLELEINQLSGSIPSTIGNMDSLQYLRLWNNSLEGPIPGSLGKLSEVTRIELSNNQLTGEVPDSLNLLTKLIDLTLDSNHLTDLPDLSTMTQLNNLWIQQNQFTFEDIEPNINISNFIYSPQDSVGEELDTTVALGEHLSFSLEVGGTANQYQWRKDSTDITGADSSALILSSISLSDSGSYICKITNTKAPDLTLYSRPIHITVNSGVQVEDKTEIIPKKFALRQNYPNPFNPVTEISYDLPHPVKVDMAIFNSQGQKVKVLVNKYQPAGSHTVQWKGKGEKGRQSASGVYLCWIEAGHFKQTIKIMLLR